MGTQRMDRNLVSAGSRVAACLVLHFQQQEIVATGARQLPGGRQSADTAPGDRNGDAARFGRRRKVGLAQAMTEQVIGSR